MRRSEFGWYVVIGILFIASSVAIGYLLGKHDTCAPSVWVSILLLFIFSGAFGGVLAAIQLAKIPELFRSSEYIWKLWRPPNVALAVVVSALGGVGGALAALFVMILGGQLRNKPFGDEEKLLYIATGVIAGFLGFRFLGKVADKLDQQMLDDMEAKIRKDTLAKAEQARKQAELQTAIALGRLVQSMRVPLTDQDKNSRAAAVRALEASIRDFPTDRQANIILGWIFAHRIHFNNPRRGIDILTSALEARSAAGMSPDKDQADFLYNRACYFYRWAFLDGTSAADRDAAKRDMYRDLRESIRITPANAEVARKEAEEGKDFAEVRAEPDFNQLCPPIVTNPGAA